MKIMGFLFRSTAQYPLEYNGLFDGILERVMPYDLYPLKTTGEVYFQRFRAMKTPLSM